MFTAPKAAITTISNHRPELYNRSRKISHAIAPENASTQSKFIISLMTPD